MRHCAERICVRGLILHEDKVLLATTRHKSGRDIYKMPGGGVEGKETLEEALVKEVLEEVGVDISDVESMDLVTTIEGRYRDYRKHVEYDRLIEHWFTATYLKENLRLYGIEGDGMKWSWSSIKEAIRLIKTNPNSKLYVSTITALQQLQKTRG